MWTVTPEHIRAVRGELAISQAELARRLGAASARGVEEWEAGRRQPPPHLWLALNALKEQAAMRRQIELMKGGTMRILHGNVDVTPEAITRTEAQIAEYDRLLGEHEAEWI